MLVNDSSGRGQSSATDRLPRQLRRAHFAFMRAVLQGLDEKQSWDRYLRSESEPADSRAVRRTIGWIKDEFAAAARREARPGTARLVRLDPERFSGEHKKLPSLEEFALERGLEDFSEAEQSEAFAAAYPSLHEGGTRARPGRPTHRARVIARQLDAVRWLESRAAPEPRASDPVSTWLNHSIARGLQGCGIGTLADLVGFINARGARWWREISGIGPIKAERVTAWLQMQDAQIFQIAPHALVPRGKAPKETLECAVAPGSEIRPWEKFRVPAALDGRSGRYRAPMVQSLLAAEDDYGAVDAWLRQKTGGARASGISATYRAYRKEAERLMLWCTLVHGKALSSLDPADIRAYCAFLANPPPEWCGPRCHQRWSPQWRPLEGRLSPVAQRHAMTVLRSLFGFLLAQRWLTANCLADRSQHGVTASPQAVGPRGLTSRQWEWVCSKLSAAPDTVEARRLARTVRWLYATGLSLRRLANSRIGALTVSTTLGADGLPERHWILELNRKEAGAEGGEGKGERPFGVVVPAALVEDLESELAREGQPASTSAPANADRFILANFAAPFVKGPPSHSALEALVRRFLKDLPPDTTDFPMARRVQASAYSVRKSLRIHRGMHP